MPLNPTKEEMEKDDKYHTEVHIADLEIENNYLRKKLEDVGRATMQVMIYSSTAPKLYYNLDCVMVRGTLKDEVVEGCGEDFFEALFDLRDQMKKRIGL